jgi:hypothetical protein
MPSGRKLRCVVYTRKSTEEGLEMEFNSLDTRRQRISVDCAAKNKNVVSVGHTHVT